MDKRLSRVRRLMTNLLGSNSSPKLIMMVVVVVMEYGRAQRGLWTFICILVKCLRVDSYLGGEFPGVILLGVRSPNESIKSVGGRAGNRFNGD